MTFIPYARSKSHSQREWRRRKRLIEELTTVIDDDISPLRFLDSNSTNSSSNDIKHKFNGTLLMDGDTTYINQNDDRSSDSSCHISSNTSDWTLSSSVDMTCSTPLYAGSPLNVRQSCIELLKLTRPLNLSKKVVKHLLNSIGKLMPTRNKLPLTISCLLNNANFLEMKRMKFICVRCLIEIQSSEDQHHSQRCSLNNKRRKQSEVGELYHANVSLQVKTVAERYNNIIKEYSINYHLQRADIPNGTMFQRTADDISLYYHKLMVHHLLRWVANLSGPSRQH